jgi:hypothetical protein
MWAWRDPRMPLKKGKRQVRTTLLQLAHVGVDADLFGFGPHVPPNAELVSVFDWLFHWKNSIPF